MTYNYFPDEINTNDVMKMRFELADTDVSKDEMSAALSDEEITAVLEQYPDNFKMAKLKLLEHMMFKYGQDVDNSVGPVSFNYGEREYSVYDLTGDIDRRDLVSESEAARILSSYCNTYDDLKKEIASSSVGIKPYEKEKREYFYVGMMNHPGGGRF